MSFIKKDVDVEELKESVYEVATNAGLSEDSVEEKINQFADEFREKGVPEEEIEVKSLRRLFASLRRRAVRNLTTLNGIVFAKTRTKDFGKQHRDNAETYVREHGREAAIDNGYINTAGKPLYKGDQYNEGVVPQDTRLASIIGYFETGDGENSGIYEIYITKSQIDEEIPLFTKVSLITRPGRQDSVYGTKKMYLDSFDGVLEPLGDVQAFANYLLTEFEDKVSEFGSISRKADQMDNNDWLITEGTVVNSGLIYEDSEVVRHEIMAVDAAEDDEILTFWVDKTILTGLGDIDGEDVLLIMKPYVKRNGEISGNIYGILPENIGDVE